MNYMLFCLVLYAVIGYSWIRTVVLLHGDDHEPPTGAEKLANVVFLPVWLGIIVACFGVYLFTDFFHDLKEGLQDRFF